MSKTAVISDCGQYRYHLTRDIPQVIRRVKEVTFIMLNPSTADADLDDPTIRRCMGFASDWGCSKLHVVNIFPLRATDPKELIRHQNPHGENANFRRTRNDVYIRNAISRSSFVICAWGANPLAKDRFNDHTCNELTAPLNCLALSKDGSPRHPLYLKKDLQPFKWEGYTNE